MSEICYKCHGPKDNYPIYFGKNDFDAWYRFYTMMRVPGPICKKCWEEACAEHKHVIRITRED